MENKIVEDLTKELEKFNQKNIKINQTGFISSQIFINNFKYKIEYDILKMENTEEKIYVNINLNQVYAIQIQDTQILLKLDNDTQIKLSF
ncbi:MAG: hypothetical protein ACI4VQ_02990 [Clostridia bacterium]